MMPHHLGQMTTPLGKDEWHTAHRTARRGELPERFWTELYIHTAHDPSIAPAGVHTMSVFAQYAPHDFSEGSWDTRRENVASAVLGSISRFCENLPGAIVEYNILGPPDIETKVGLSGGHIFQGECLPEYMWDRRLGYRTPMEGLYLCGACTYPGGSVIGVNGRNAAAEILGAWGP
jgi:phytoene dehydrogenase-like protein